MNLDINEISNTKFEFLSNTCTTVENQFSSFVLLFLKNLLVQYTFNIVDTNYNFIFLLFLYFF